MHVFHGIDEITDDFQRAVVTIGNFDGVHQGHQHIFHNVVREARRENSKSVVITFEPHPKMVLHPERRPFYLITSIEEKIARIADTGIDGVLLIPFSLEFAKTTAREFVCSILWDSLHIKKIYIGHDYAFGQGKEGNEACLAAFGQKLGFSVEAISAFRIGDRVISSTLTRNAIQEGKVRDAAEWLGRPYNLSGTVEAGYQRGRDLGFPTANLKPDKVLIPMRGIYAVRILLEGQDLQGVLNIGYNPTFGNDALSIEVYIIDFHEDIYGKRMEVLFIDRIRDEMKFDSPELLIEQIRKDVKTAGEILSRS